MTKSDKIRRMLAKGTPRTEIIRKLKCNPSMVYKLAKEKHNRAWSVSTVDLEPVALQSVAHPAPVTVNDIQIGGDHYKKYGDFQPWDAWTVWNLNPFQAAILKYVVRYRDKEGVKDLEKARHFLDKLIEVERGK